MGSESSSGGVGPELVIALVRPIGVPREALLEPIEAALNRLGYRPVVVRLSSLLEPSRSPNMSATQSFLGEDTRVETLIEAARAFCDRHKQADALAKLAIQEIRRIREVENEHMTGIEDTASSPLKRVAFVIDSLKRPAEVTTLRQVYADRFFLIGGFIDEESRIQQFRDKLRSSYKGEPPLVTTQRARDLIIKDDNEPTAFGQNVRKTFPMSDLIVKVELHPGQNSRGHHSLEIARFFDLIFQSPRYSPPTVDELAMHLADTASAMTTALGRKVGACIISRHGKVIALGHNEVPTGERTDTEIGFDTSDSEIQSLALEVLEDLSRKGFLSDDSKQKLADDASVFLGEIGDLPLRGLIEFQRPVHAEMTAMMDAARQGIALHEAAIYTTTYPCHLCAKHIVTLGLDPVVYIEPYPKSKAESMYETAVKSTFRPFNGVTPRAFGRLFAAPDSDRKAASGALTAWDPKTATPRIPRDFQGFAINDAESVVLHQFIIDSPYRKESSHE